MSKQRDWRFFPLAIIIGLALLTWANHYGIRWFSWQMLFLYIIMHCDRTFYTLWITPRGINKQ